MTRSRNKYDLSRLEPYLRSKPMAENKELYLLCHATTLEQKGSVRKGKSRILKKIQKAESYTNNNESIMTQKKNVGKSHFQSPTGGSLPAPSIPDYKNVNIKSLIKNWSIHQLYKDSRMAGQALQALVKPEFIEQGEIKHNVYWTSDLPPYVRPRWLYSWQNLGIELMKHGHCMWQASRQKPGKTTAAGVADFEDALAKPGTVVSVFAPTVPVGKTLMRQMFKEVITLEDGSKFDLWNQLYKPYFLIDNVLEKVLKNGSRIQIITLDYKAVQGLASDVIHIEELDKAVREPQKLEAIAALFPQIRARKGTAKIRITCNNASGIYRIFRDELKQFGQYFSIYMEKPNTNAKFTGEHFIFNEHIYCKEEPDVDEILKVIMDTAMGQGYTQMQLYNVDDYTGDLWNPDKLEKAYNKTVPNKTHFEHSCMGIDPGAIHAFAITVYGMDGMEVFHLATKRFSLSDTPKDRWKDMIDMITDKAAYLYCKYHCEFVASESNSGAKLIIPHIGKKVAELKEELKGRSHAVWREIWSNFAGDSEMLPNVHHVSRADYITLMQYLIDNELITFQDRDNDEHIQRIEFARYAPDEPKEKMKGDCVDSSLHACWWLTGGMKFIERIMGKTRKTGMVTW